MYDDNIKKAFREGFLAGRKAILREDINEDDFVIEDGVLVKYLGVGGSVIIPDSVTEIGECAFEGCTALKSITLPNGIEYIDEYAFADSGIQSIIIPESVEDISACTFTGCKSLKSVTLTSTLSEIGESAFEGCSSLENIDLTKVESFGDAAFLNCSSLKSIVLSERLFGVDQSVFEGCTSLESVRIPKRVILIQPDAFANCTNLRTAIIEGKDTDIFEGFEGCPSLTITCHRNSPAEKYAEDNDIPVNYIR